ncbi:MAG TPA: hypothetical protein PLU71_04915 [Candidatus Dependentiae bacterium]|nr:hypothetical protein [Candidatus Dependentiae bacterium]HRQ63176.1 hypothetical protein [Candidatus Dependentiae bacterium]
MNLYTLLITLFLFPLSSHCMHINDMPMDMLIQIFSYLIVPEPAPANQPATSTWECPEKDDKIDLVKHAWQKRDWLSLVCRHWQSAATTATESFYQDYDISQETIFDTLFSLFTPREHQLLKAYFSDQAYADEERPRKRRRLHE